MTHGQDHIVVTGSNTQMNAEGRLKIAETETYDLKAVRYKVKLK